jgi:hypothetical protein
MTAKRTDKIASRCVSKSDGGYNHCNGFIAFAHKERRGVEIKSKKGKED